MDMLRFVVPLNAGIVVLVPNGEDPPPLDGARVQPIPLSQAQDRAALLARLRELRSNAGFEFMIVPADLLPASEGLESLLADTFERVDDGAPEGRVFSLHERPADGHTGPDGLPLPPMHLVRITSGCARQARKHPERVYRSFLPGGERGAGRVRDMVARAGADIHAMDAILDFGCGCGRILRHWRDLAGVDVHGCDYNPYLVRWCEDSLPFARFEVNELEPPLPYENDRFDLVYSISIFTHLDEGLQRPWIEELARITRPGGLVLVTLDGPAVAGAVLRPEDLERFERGELVVKRSELAGMNACSVLHPVGYVRNELARGFELVEHTVRDASDVRQDAVLLRVPA